MNLITGEKIIGELENNGGVMSYKKFLEAIKLSSKCNGYLIGGEKPNDVIINAENILDLKFSKQNYEYFKKLGFLEFEGNEIYGIILDNFTGTCTGASVETAINERKKYNLPKQWLPIYFFDDGYMGYLDYSNLNEYGEPPVIMAIYTGENYEVVEKVAEDLGDFLLNLVNEQLDNQ